jgi:dTDP-4-dehydrorhamnose reductase
VRHAVLGAAGQLGCELCQRLPGEVVPLDRARADVTRPEALRAVLDEVVPDVVVNCTAYNFVDRAESEPATAFAVNAFAARDLAAWCREHGKLLVHFSTDHVFGLEGGRQSPYHEADPPGPVSVYGTSKLTGEYFVRAGGPFHVIVRTCGLYGPRGTGGKGTNFVETMLRLAGQGRPLGVVVDQRCTPTPAADLAQRVVELLERNARGLFHVTSSGQCSWHEFACAIFDLVGLRVEVTPITTAEYGAAAPRPGYSVLASDRSSTLGLAPMRSWRDGLADYLARRPASSP